MFTFLASSLLAPARDTSATASETVSAGSYTLSLSATPTVNLNVGVLEVPVMTVGVGTVSTSTTAPNGYKLYLSMAGTSNDLRRTGSDVDTISATTGTFTNPVALDIGYWGYAIPSGTEHIATNHFDASYSTMESAYPASTKFAAPPASTATAQLVTSTSAPNTTANEFSVYYGVNADDTTPLGNYTGSVVWTAIADAAETASASVSPANGAHVGGDTITVSTSLFSISGVTGDVYMLTDAQYQQITPNNPVSSLGVSPMTCDKTSASNLTFTCTTPANTPGNNYHVYVDIPRYEKTYEASFTYFNQPEFYQITNMQDMTGLICSTATIPNANATHMDVTGFYAGNKDYVPTVTLTDTRGATPYKTYTVKRLADGKCWMTDNLAIENATLNSSNSNLPANKTVNLPSSSTSLWCTANSQACDDQLMTLSYADAGSDTSGHPEYGNYYNWYTATATYGGYNTTTDTSYSICPKGWRLPKGGSSGEFQALYNKYNSTSAMQDANGPNFILVGYHRGGSTDAAGTVGGYWSSTAYNNNNNIAYSLFLDSSSSDVYPADDSSKYLGLAVRCVADDPEFFKITTMQQMTNDICQSVPTPKSTATTSVTSASAYFALDDPTSQVPQLTLKDTRDQNNYTVKKLADGKCWMTQNLRLTGQRTLYKTDTDITANSWPLPATNSTFPSSCVNTAYNMSSGNSTYGAYYNWYAATAGTGTCAMTTGNAGSSICPLGWRLPYGGTSDNNDFATLYQRYPSSELMRGVPAFVFSGYRYISNTSDQNSVGLYWSNTTTTDTGHAYGLYINNLGVGVRDTRLKLIGFPIRCVAR